MLYIPNTNHDPALNLAMEEYILTASGIQEPILFFYVNAPSIIIGRHQNTRDEINMNFVRENHIKIVRRCSGGGAVYHDLGNLNYSLINPGNNKNSGDFSVLLTPILEAFHELGLPAELGGRNDLLVDGAKFSGNAYYQNRYGCVTHGTILFDSDLQVLSKALQPDPQKLQAKGIQSVRSRVCCIKQYLPEINDVQELEAAIVRHFAYKNNLSTRTFTGYDHQKSQELADSKYRTDLWTFGESPAFSFRRLVHQASGWIDFRADIRENELIHARFFGDFFCTREITPLEEALEDQPWDKTNIINALNGAKWDDYFPNYPLDDFINELFSEKAGA